MLTRIYGTAFFSQKDLDEHLERARGGEGARPPPPRPRARAVHAPPRGARGCPSGCPEGTVLLRLVEAEVREQLRRGGYVEIKTPQVLDEELWHRSGHWDNYKENMYFAAPAPNARAPGRSPLRPEADELPRAPASSSARSATPTASCRCAWPSSATSRATSARACCTDCCASAPSPRTTPTSTARSTRSPTRSTRICRAIDELYARFGFDDVRVELSTRPEKSIGTDEQWERAEGALREALERQGRDYEVSPGEGTFYGPKIDFHVTDALGRSWQLGTCQLDFQMPERFDLSYTGEDDSPHRPVMIHRALLGSMERFIGILIEHHAGRFPVWLAPTQAVVLPIADRHAAVRRRGSRRSSRDGRAARARRRSLGVGGAQDPRRRAREGARTCSSWATARRRTARCRVRSARRARGRGRVHRRAWPLACKRPGSAYTPRRCRAPTHRAAAERPVPPSSSRTPRHR